MCVYIYLDIRIYICMYTYTWAFLEAQMIKNLPAVPKTWVRPLVWEDP